MWYKVWKIGLKGKIWRILKNLYKKKEAKVRIAGGLSDAFETECGVTVKDAVDRLQT